MLNVSYLSALKRELFVRGVWGNEAARLCEQLADHYAASVAEKIEAGESAVIAERLAEESLGAPSLIAEAKAANLQSNRWLSRHPWLGGIAFFWGVLVFSFAFGFIGVGAAVIIQKLIPGFNLPVLEKPFLILSYWLPLICGCILLLRFGKCSLGSWKPLLIAAATIGFASAIYYAGVQLPTRGPGSGSINLGLYYPTNLGPDLYWRLFRMVLPLLMMICLRYNPLRAGVRLKSVCMALL